MNQPAQDLDMSTSVRSAIPKPRVFVGAWKWLLGAVSCQAPLLAVIGAGWGYRMARRSALKAWWKMPGDAGESFRQLASRHTILQPYERTPHWILAQPYKPHRLLRRWLQSLGENLWLGLRAWAHSLVFLTIPSVLMMVSWYAGWDNSFNKGYEQFHVGQQLGLLGVLLFVLVMLYLPMAQARFAVTQGVRSFYQFRIIRQVIRREWLACACLVAGYALAGLPLMGADSYLGLATGENTSAKPNSIADFSAQEALGFLQSYYFFWGFYVFAAFVFLRCWAARIYARGMRKALQCGRLDTTDLSMWEREALSTLGIDTQTIVPISKGRSLASHVGRVALGGTAAILLWSAFSIETYVSQFFTAQPVIKRWVNRPFVQVPWFHHIPEHLKDGLLEPPL